jgi:hypothetical protein
MEIRLNVLLFVALGSAVAWLNAAEPRAELSPQSEKVSKLMQLEDAIALNPADRGALLELSARYMDLDRPGLAIAVLRAADRNLLRDPAVLERLAVAYEASGRISDAVATAEIGLARCARALGTRDASATPVPAFGCTERQYGALQIHRRALEYMALWGVTTPRVDPRSKLAYDAALRRVRVAAGDSSGLGY